MNKIQTNLDFFNKGANLTNIILYTKYFITEAVIANKLDSKGEEYLAKDGMKLDEFNKMIKKELEFYYQRFNEIRAYRKDTLFLYGINISCKYPFWANN